MSYLYKVFLSIDQLANTLAVGNPDNTISARLGYLNYDRIEDEGLVRKANPHWYWRMLELIVNTTFEPVDGKEHCLEAYYNDAGERFDESASNIGLVIVSFFVVFGCLVLFLPFRVVGIFRSEPVDPNKERPQKVKERLELIEQRLQALVFELEENKFDALPGTKEKCDEIVKRTDEVKTVIQKASALNNGDKSDSAEE